MATKACKLGVQQLESRRLLASVSLPTAIAESSYDDSAPAEVSTPIEVSGAQGVRAAEVRIQFDPNEVTTDTTRIQAGSLWNGRGTVIANVDEHSGTIVAYVYSTQPVAEDAGGLIDIGFAVKPDRISEKTIDIDLQQVRLNEGQISLAQTPKVGADTSDGKIVTQPSDSVKHVTRIENRSSESSGESWSNPPVITEDPCPWPGGADTVLVAPQANASVSLAPVSLVGQAEFVRPEAEWGRPELASGFTANAAAAKSPAARSIDSMATPRGLPYGPLQPHVVDQAFADSALVD
ncbi:cohesin domain-containing protein [Novipirellula caenicola]|uniref:Cohesin domain-containing protein n=1 Tax=Novipirellula caenicola TaxID=1536901 RepID=A0ABP9VUE2_9BACT